MNPTNESPFARALQSQDVEALRLLLTKKPSLNAPIDNGALPLVLALGAGGGRGGFLFGVAPSPFRFPGERSPAAAAKLLLDAGADVNAVNAAGDTALHAVAQNGEGELIQLLAEHGAKLELKDKAGLTALDMAMGKRAPGAAAGGRGGGPPGRGGGPPRPQPAAVTMLRKLMGMPPLAPDELPAVPAGRGPGPQGN